MNLNDIQMGQEVEYHIGNLAVDRESNNKLDDLANQFLSRSTAILPMPKKSSNMEIERCDEGTGEFALYQKKIMVGATVAYRYLAKRIKKNKY